MRMFSRFSSATAKANRLQRLLSDDEQALQDAERRIAHHKAELAHDDATDPQADHYLLRQAEQDASVARANIRDILQAFGGHSFRWAATNFRLCADTRK